MLSSQTFLTQRLLRLQRLQLRSLSLSLSLSFSCFSSSSLSALRIYEEGKGGFLVEKTIFFFGGKVTGKVTDGKVTGKVVSRLSGSQELSRS